MLMKRIYSFLMVLILLSTIKISGQSIYEIQGQTGVSPYEGQTVSTSGVVTGCYANGYFIQDGEGAWCGIYVFDSQHSPQIGDLVNLTGLITEYYELTEIKNISAFEVVSSGNTLPSPTLVGTAEVSAEAFEGVLVRVTNAECTNANIGYGEWEANDGSGVCVIDDLLYVFVPQQGTSYTITGVVYYSYSVFKIEPRNAADIQIASEVYIVDEPQISQIQNNSFTLSWQTNIEANTVVELGETTNYELGTFTVEALNTEHSITLSNLTPATIYYAKIYSLANEVQTPSFERIYATASNSTGEIKVYFNHTVDTSVATGENAIVAEGSIADSVIAYVEKATQTLDFTMYETEATNIIEAINAAKNRGVAVRVITDSDANNVAFDNLLPEIPILRGNDLGIMHDKFMIIDAESAENSWVITGSLNHTEANLGWDFNNMICIQDQSLAKAYRLEFNEMWGSTSETPDAQNAKFGEFKTNNTPHVFNINNTTIELYFSPSDNTEMAINKAISATQEDLEFAVLVFTSDNLGNTIKNMDTQVNIRGIIDYVESTGSEFETLVQNDIYVVDYQNADGSQWPDGPTLHHKYAIIDFNNAQRATLITGSHNWSASAETRNDENTLIIHNQTVANLYHQEFNQRFHDQLHLSAKKLSFENAEFTAFPNPAKDYFYLKINSQSVQKADIIIYNSTGNVIHSITENLTQGTNLIKIDNLNYHGLCFISLKINNFHNTFKLFKH